jgi:hypothetical protein
MTPVPLVQSAAFAAACRLMGQSVRFGRRRRNGAPEADWLIQRRRFARFGRLDLVSRGPVCHGPVVPNDLLAGILGSCPGGVLFNAPNAMPDALRRHGFWPLMTPASVALLPLAQVSEMRARMLQKWRNRLNRAADHRLRLCTTTLDRAPDHWLITSEAQQAASRGYRNWPETFTRAFATANPGAALVFEARQHDVPVAAMLFLRHGPSATYHAGVTTTQGRKVHAHNWLMWQAMTHFAGDDLRQIDLGLVNTHDAPGLARFKIGTGADIVQLGGTWLWHPVLAPVARRLPRQLAA